MDNVEKIESNDDFGKTTFDQNSVATTIVPVLAQQQMLTHWHITSPSVLAYRRTPLRHLPMNCQL